MKLLWVIGFIGLSLGISYALPLNMQEFQARYQTEAKTPEGAIKMHFEAILCYLDPLKRKEASKMLSYSMHLSKPLEELKNYKSLVQCLEDSGHNQIFLSFIKGAYSRSNYNLSTDKLEINILKKYYHKGYL
ncbi:MAG: hypothetical protein IJU40_02340, partial [Desulfovibrionaceae bacterium]|nr:hypothetical protein [Desulfovibrionaceae bacterium]